MTETWDLSGIDWTAQVTGMFASRLQLTPNGRKLWNWLTGKGMSVYIAATHPWTTLRDFLLRHGVPANQAGGEATNIMMATPAGRIAFKAHHGKGHK